MKTTLPLAALVLALAACDSSGSKPAGPASTASAAAANLKEGDAAPDVELPLQNGKTVRLSSLKGKLVAIYFYPKDQTQGCTVEAQGLRDKWEDLKAANITVIGVSTQDAASHQAFIDKEKLPFDLAIDESGEIAKAFQVPLNNGVSGRQTFLVDEEGRLKKVWREVKPQGHAEEILAAAKNS